MYDVIVIGGGAVGLATALNLSKSQVKTMLIEQLTCPNTRGSSSGQSRVLSFNQSEYNNQLTSLALDEWKKIGQYSSTPLLLKSKQLFLGDKSSVGFHSGKTQGKRKPVKGLKYLNSTQFLGESPAYILKTVKCLQALKDAFLEHQGVLMEEEKVIEIKPIHDEKIEVHTVKGIYLAKKVIMACGPWTNQLLRPLEIQLPLQIYRYQVAYFKTSAFPLYEYKSGFPVISFNKSPTSSVLVTPIYEYPDLVKMEMVTDGVEVEADRRDRIQLTSEERSKEKCVMDEMVETIKTHLPHINQYPSIIETMISCKIADDDSFVVDRHCDYENVIIACGFGANQFVLAPAIACLLTSLVFDEDRVDTDCDVENIALLQQSSLRRFESLTETL